MISIKSNKKTFKKMKEHNIIGMESPKSNQTR